MSYLALARKWRPKEFSEVIGQEHVVSALTNALNSQRVHHAFLFTGTRGVGKTTLARIFARALNCEKGISAQPCGDCIACKGLDQGNFVDLIEVDAASRTKVEDTRDLLENVQYTPTQGRFKIYLIDEVHMLSAHSFNALLKTLEEPPEHVKFLLATTNPQKLPTTILSRCIQFNLKSVDIGRLCAQLEKILKSEGFKYDSSALLVLSRSANGSVRDALSLLDQAIAFGNGDVSSSNVRSMLGMIDDQFIYQLLDQVIQNKIVEVLETVSSMAERSVDYRLALDELLTLIHNVSLYQVSPASVEWKGVDTTSLGELADCVDAETLQLLCQIAIIGKRDFEFTPDPRSGFEMVLIRMLAFRPHGSDASDNLQKPGREARPVPVPERSEKPVAGIVKTEINSVNDCGTDAQSPDLRGIVSALTEKEPSGFDGSGMELQRLLDTTAWQQFIQDSGLGGISKEILMNMVPKSVQGNIMNLALDSASRHLFNEDRLKKIEIHCEKELSMKVQFKVEISDLNTSDTEIETPSRLISRQQKERESAARQAFTHDSNVQELVDLFDAEIVTESIKPDQS
jgi:DNA polymerase-3 subunit gamma/tau